MATRSRSPCNFYYGSSLYHHGVLGQKWGKRNGPPYPLDENDHSASEKKAGYKRSLGGRKNSDLYGRNTSVRKRINKKYSLEKLTPARRNVVDNIVATYESTKVSMAIRKSGIGKKYVDTYLDVDTSFYRIQSNDTFENFAFYATYKQHDIDEYSGLFGKNLRSRAAAEAKNAEKSAQTDEEKEAAKSLKEAADSMSIYQLNIKNKESLKIPSEENCCTLIRELVKDKQFKEDLHASLVDSASKMKRPSQQMLFKESIKALNKENERISNSDMTNIYRALNLSLTNHNEQEVRMQDKFYGALKQNGYSALLDLNDNSYSSYHAHSPVIIFDTSKVKLQSVAKMDNDRIETLYRKYNAERIRKEIPEQVIGNLRKYGSMKASKAIDYTATKWDEYLGTRR